MRARNEVSQIDWARLAAYIDGEGCIRIDTQNPSPGNDYRPRHLLEVRVYNCDPRLVIWCRDTFGGGNLKPVRKKKNFRKHQKEEQVWYIGAAAAERILRGCLPYFILKRSQAEVALAFRALVGRAGQRVSAEIFAAREDLQKQMAMLNRKGVADTVSS